MLALLGFKIGLAVSNFVKSLNAHFEILEALGPEKLQAVKLKRMPKRKYQEFILCRMLKDKLLFPILRLFYMIFLT